MATAGKKQDGAKMAMDAVWFVLHIILNIVFYAIAIFLIYRAATFAYDFCFQVFGNNTVDQAPGVNIELSIEDGASTMDIASILEANRVIENRYSFYIKVKLLNSNILAGTYVINTSMTYDEILSTITNYSNSLEAAGGGS